MSNSKAVYECEICFKKFKRSSSYMKNKIKQGGHVLCSVHSRGKNRWQKLPERIKKKRQKRWKNDPSSRPSGSSQVYECDVCSEKFERDRSGMDKRIIKGNRVLCPYHARCAASTKRWENRSKESKQQMWSKASEAMKEYCKTLSPEERSKKAKKAGAANTSKSVHAQWESIKSDPEKYAQACERLKKTAQNFHDGMSDEEKEEHYQKVFENNQGVCPSKAETDFLDRVENALEVTLQRSYSVSGFMVDGYHAESNTIIEFYGDIYHCNPDQFNDPDQYCSWIDRTVREQWKRDERRTAALLHNGYSLVIVWESDWDTQPEIELQRVKDEVCEN